MTMEAQKYLEQFDLTPPEMKLKILNCCTENLTNTPNIVSISRESLPKLSYPDQMFDLALCSNVLFVAEKPQSIDFHLEVLLELARIAGEVRIFPVVDKSGQPSHYLGPILKALSQKGMGVEIKEIKHGDALGGAVLRIWNESCHLNKL